MLQINPEEVSLQASVNTGPQLALAWTMSYSQLGSSQHAAQETALRLLFFLLFSSFAHRSLSFPFTVTSLPFLVCLLLSQFIHNSAFQLNSKYIYGFSSVIPLSVFKACGTLFLGCRKSAWLRALQEFCPRNVSDTKYFQLNCVVLVIYGEFSRPRTSSIWGI